MRLKSLKLAGFKSFVDPTTVPMPSQLIGVVGPNGCGKSNIIDAVRWVMGESAAKQLRGDSLADVIFNGSTNRKPVGQASIELVFDNSEGKAGGQYANFAEISVKRQISRDGQSLYFLNSARCRRRDITDIFLGTGLGPRSYAIIEQGTISRLIEAKPEELRDFIEEAAGISKYKERRRETENRIRHTKDNLDRINDLREEIDKRLTVLKRQATQAEKYKNLKNEERVVKSQHIGLKWRNLSALLEEKERTIKALDNQLEALRADVFEHDARLEKARESQVEANQEFNDIQGRFYALGAEVARLEEGIANAKALKEEREQELERLKQALLEAQTAYEGDKSLIVTLEAALESQEQEYQDAKSRSDISQARRESLEDEMHEWREHWDEFNHASQEQLRTAEVEQVRLQQSENLCEQLQTRLNRLVAELETLVDQGLAQQLEALEEQLSNSEHEKSLHRERLDDTHEAIHQERENVNHARRALDETQGRLQTQRAKLKSLETLQKEALEAGSSAQVEAWCRQHALDDLPRAIEALNVEEGWERAVEVVLGSHLEAICVDDLERNSNGIAEIKEGQVELMQTSTPVAASVERGDGVALLAHKAHGLAAMTPLLNQIRIADSLEHALAMRSSLTEGESVVTRDGVWLGRDWLRVAKGKDARQGILAREQLIKSLEDEINADEAALEQCENTLEQHQRQLQELEQQREHNQERLNETVQQCSRLEAELTAKQQRKQQMDQRSAQNRREIEEIQNQLAQEEEKITQSRKALHEALEQNEQFQQKRDHLLSQRETLQQQLDDVRHEAQEDQDQTHDAALQVKGTITQIEAIKERVERTQQHLDLLTQQRERLDSELNKGDEEDPIEVMQQRLSSRLDERTTVEEQLTAARESLTVVDNLIRQTSHDRQQHEQQAQDVANRLQQESLTVQEQRVRRQTFEEQLQSLNVQLAEVLESMPEEADETAWAARLEQLEKQIQRLGAINLAAIEEYDTESERKSYIDKQHADLTEALETLESAIQKIDRETRTRFKDTFDKVNAGLQRMFPRLFGGGHAYLDLTGDDLLTTGVTVMARPPGKRNSTIHLLSGGEKALTAVAMVFSIFELNPAPFCMLDEVDAPLDDANVGRFCQMVKEMSERVQFIVITHNKVTMEMVHHLTGVTMHEPGVSRLVAVDVDEAVALAG